MPTFLRGIAAVADSISYAGHNQPDRIYLKRSLPDGIEVPIVLDGLGATSHFAAVKRIGGYLTFACQLADEDDEANAIYAHVVEGGNAVAMMAILNDDYPGRTGFTDHVTDMTLVGLKLCDYLSSESCFAFVVEDDLIDYPLTHDAFWSMVDYFDLTQLPEPSLVHGMPERPIEPEMPPPLEAPRAPVEGVAAFAVPLKTQPGIVDLFVSTAEGLQAGKLRGGPELIASLREIVEAYEARFGAGDDQ